MKTQWLAACAVGLMAAAPASALEIRIDPAPIYVFDLSPDRGLYDVVLQNILVVNDEADAVDVRGLRVETPQDRRTHIVHQAHGSILKAPSASTDAGRAASTHSARSSP